jgi:murein L,D-transpeptidase YcbB/YkuD
LQCILLAAAVVVVATGQAVSAASINWAGTSISEFSARYWLRQAPGPGNALGFVKFIFPNPYDVFLHDTPDRHLFERGPRAFSSGCMRLEGALDLAVRLLAGVPGWGDERIHQVANGGTEVWVRLPNPVPIQSVYWTAWVASDGTLNLVDDLYGLDAQRSSVAMLEEGMSECSRG